MISELCCFNSGQVARVDKGVSTLLKTLTNRVADLILSDSLE